IAEGADAVMIKPAMGYLDLIARAREAVDVPVAAYNVSGELAMIEAAAERGWLEREPAIDETLLSIRRAGADIVLTYWALERALEWTRARTDARTDARSPPPYRPSATYSRRSGTYSRRSGTYSRRSGTYSRRSGSYLR